jgi:hypothetical protein
MFGLSFTVELEFIFRLCIMTVIFKKYFFIFRSVKIIFLLFFKFIFYFNTLKQYKNKKIKKKFNAVWTCYKTAICYCLIATMGRI